MRLDSGPSQRRSLASGQHDPPKRRELLDAETVKELSGGSLAGMCPCLSRLPGYFILPKV
jgi:hypothetical protein